MLEKMLWKLVVDGPESKRQVHTDCIYQEGKHSDQWQNKNKPSLSGQRQPAAALYNLFTLEHKFLGSLSWDYNLVSYFCHAFSRPFTLLPFLMS